MGAIRVLIAIFVIAIALNNFHARPVGIKLVGEDAGKAGANAVSHLCAMGNDEDGSIGLNAKVDAGMKRSCVNRGRHVSSDGCPISRGLCEKWGLAYAKNKRAGGKHALQKTAPACVFDRQFDFFFFDIDHAVSFAASLMAARMR